MHAKRKAARVPAQSASTIVGSKVITMATPWITQYTHVVFQFSQHINHSHHTLIFFDIYAAWRNTQVSESVIQSSPSVDVLSLSAETVPEPADFAPCAICGRTFNHDVLVSQLAYAYRNKKLTVIIMTWLYLVTQARHAKICAKNTAKKRPVFDSQKHRILGTDMQKYKDGLPPSKRGRPSTSEKVH